MSATDPETTDNSPESSLVSAELPNTLNEVSNSMLSIDWLQDTTDYELLLGNEQQMFDSLVDIPAFPTLNPMPGPSPGVGPEFAEQNTRHNIEALPDESNASSTDTSTDYPISVTSTVNRDPAASSISESANPYESAASGRPNTGVAHFDSTCQARGLAPELLNGLLGNHITYQYGGQQPIITEGVSVDNTGNNSSSTHVYHHHHYHYHHHHHHHHYHHHDGSKLD